MRRIVKIFESPSQREGAGFIVHRPFPGRFLKDEQCDPFLLLDEGGPKEANIKGAGAPWHPHRGFDTVTYIKSGVGAHQDSMGNKGLIKSGEVQWMRAGSGVIHDEGPPSGMTEEEFLKHGTKTHGFQLWVNLPPELKMSPPAYHHLTQETFKWVPVGKNAEAKVIAGDISSDTQLRRSPLDLAVPVLYADIVINASPEATVVPIDAIMDTCIVYVYSGEGRVFDGEGDEAGTVVKAKDCVVYADPVTTPRDSIKLVATSEAEGLKVLLMAGKKIKAPIARYGPFVMNTDEELKQAMADYHHGKLASVKAADNRY